MSSYSSTDSYLTKMDDSSTSTTRNRSNSLFDNPTAKTPPWIRRRSNSLFENPANSAINLSSPTPQHRRVQSNPIHNSVVEAMITSNNLRNCHEVEEMVVKCLNNKDKESFVGKTAQRYIGRCQK